MLNRHEYRERIVFSIYQHLLLHKPLSETFQANFEDDEDEFMTSIRDDLIVNEETYIGMIGPHLQKWTFDRLNLVEQAILLAALSEIELKLNDSAVIIDEAVILAKTYCDEESYRFINGVLDNLCRR